MDTKFEEIKRAYKKLHDEFLLKNPILVKYHDKGIWAPSLIKELSKIFQRFEDKDKTFFDMGSGDGIAVMAASLFFKHAYGIEIDKHFFDISIKMKKQLEIENCTFMQGDFYDHDISKYDILYIAPDTEFTLKLENKIERELNGILIVYSSIFQPKTLKKVEEFQTHHFQVCVYENKARKV